MAPPGRRRHPSRGPLPLQFLTTLLLSIFLVSLPSTVSAASSAVLGIDLGTEYLKAALVKPGVPLEIVLTKDSKRKETAAVAFKPARESDAVFPERFYGGDALALAPRFPDDVYSNLKVLLGIPFATGVQGPDGNDENKVTMFKARNPALDIGEAPGRGTVGFKSGKLAEEQGRDRFMVEELLAMQLKQIRLNAESMGGQRSPVTDAVITIPPFYTAEEKRSVELAAELAGLNVAGLISDGLAVGLHYATSRTFPSVTDGKAPEYHVVYDMGAGHATATVLRFQSRIVKDIGRFNKTVQEVQVVGTGWDKTLGGDAFNQLVVNDIIEKLVSSKKLKDDVTVEQVKAHGRTMSKLWKDSERVRQILSANTETGASFETLFQEDVNFKYKISRSEFETLAKKHAERVVAPLTAALAEAKLTLDDVESVILHGGAIRTPFVQKQLELACKGTNKLRTNVNADEAAVFGAAFKGAALSSSFRVKEIRAGDTPVFAAGLKWTSGDKERQQKLFTPQSEIGAEKQVTMKNLEDFEFSFYQQFTRNGESIDAPVLGVQTKNLTESVASLKDKFGCVPANITTQFSFRLNPVDGLPEVVGGSVSCEVEPEKKGMVEDMKDFFGLGSKKTDQDPLGEESAKESVTLEDVEPSTSASSTTTTTSSETASPSAEAPKEAEKEAKEVKPRIESIPIKFTTSRLGLPSLSPAELQRVKDRLAAFDASDLARFRREEKFNALEAFIYRTQDLVTNEEFIKNISKESLTTLESRLSEASDWLYGDGVDAPIKDLTEKLRGLTELVDPAIKRQEEHSLRPSKIDSLKQSLESTKMFLDLMKKQVEAAESFKSAPSSSTESSSESSTASSESSTTSSAPAAESSSDDSFASLEEESSSSTSTSSTTSSPSAKPTPVSIYTPEDISSLSATYETIHSWIESQVEKQSALSEADEPVITIAELDTKMRELERALNKIMAKMSRQQGGGWGNNGGGGEKPKKAKKEKKEKKEKKKDKKDKEDKKDKKAEKEKIKDEL
ncbi:hypothetical protein AJ80_00103 [Polytolypa hystricis UAMH7299]|uniref:Hsp70-like protein n=1 Tax=Polytolypa hystricis (strain UAMH7299) TaxID=1447883 RepID=A0A2B7Z4Q0_POLH7|nr:hypothetical protein AJ80_00103 [Polytolypa hystricis UAMH7299]